jgi:hypothetical protein
MYIQNFMNYFWKIRLFLVCLVIFFSLGFKAMATSTDTTQTKTIEFFQTPPDSSNALIDWISQITHMNRLSNWIVAGVLLVVLYFVVKKRQNLNDWFSRIGHRSDTEDFASKRGGGAGIKRSTILQNYFPIQRPWWWMIAPGLLFGLMLIGGAIWNTGETEWYFSEGAHIIPSGFTLTLHWALWALSLVMVLLIVALAMESFSIAGPWAGLLRLAMLVVLNAMAMVVFLYVLSGAIILIIGIIALFFILAMLFGGRRRY